MYLWSISDSVIFVTREGEENPPLGVYLGQLTSETGSDFILELCAAGPKNYAYALSDEDKTEVCKVSTLPYLLMK